MKKIRCRRISKGAAEGPALVSNTPINFLGDIDPDKGVVVRREHPLYGKPLAGRILVFPSSRGSTAGSYTIYRMAKRGVAPKAMVMREAEPIVAVGAIISDIPLVDRPESFDFRDGVKLRVDADSCEITILD